MTHSFPTRRPSDLQGIGLPFTKIVMELAVVGGQRLRQTWHEQRQQLCRWLIIRFDGLENFYREERANIIDAERVGDFVETIRSEEHTSELQSLMSISYAVFCLKKKTKIKIN